MNDAESLDIPPGLGEDSKRLIRYLVTRIDAQASRIEDLEEQLDEERHRRREQIEEEQRARSQTMSDRVVKLRDEIDDVRSDVQNEQKTRSQQDALLKQKIAIIADDTDVDLTERRLRGQDKITRVLREGPEAVTNRVFPVHERARDVLENVGEWGTISNDKFGHRFTITAAEARQRLKDKRGEELEATEVRRVFQKLVEWCGEPRHASVDKNENGERRFRMVINDGTEQ